MWNDIRQDFAVYHGDFANRGLWVMCAYRFGQWRYQIRWSPLRKPFSLAYKALKLVTEILTGVELPCETVVGSRLRIEHVGGIVISGDAQLGDDVILRNGVTIGLRRTGVRGAPKIGNRVDIGAGAKLLGDITIGDDVSIGANAVVLRDVPPNSIAVGIPARVLPRREAAAAAGSAFEPEQLLEWSTK